MLHIIKTTSAMKDVMSAQHDDDQFVFIETAVYTVINENLTKYTIKDQKDRCFFLKEDLEARGLNKIARKDVQLIDYKGFALLTEQHAKSITWE